ncbi:MAG: hypothetical protein P8179_15030 [Candidatus Thiodiazotropha sp.]|jgi:hypothetical protein
MNFKVNHDGVSDKFGNTLSLRRLFITAARQEHKNILVASDGYDSCRSDCLSTKQWIVSMEIR